MEERFLTRIQNLLFALMENASFNNFNGKKVVQDLKDNSHLWKSATMIEQSSGSVIILRDIDDGRFTVDTLYILSSGVDDQKLELLVSTWSANAIDWTGEYAIGKVLRVWWD